MNRHSLLLASLSLSTLAIACGSSSSPSTSSAAVDDDLTATSELTAQETALVVTTVSGATFVADPSASAAAAASALTAALVPTGCATAKVTTTHAIYTFSGCSGPYGLAAIDGTVTVDYAVTASQVTAAIKSTNLSIGGATLDLDATATYAQSAAAKSVSFTTNDTATTAAGRAVAIDASYQASWNTSTACVTLTGSGTTTAGDLSWSSSVSGYQRCGSSCPAAGGKVSFTGPAGRSVTVSYDGSAEASYSDASGGAGKVTLACS